MNNEVYVVMYSQAIPVRTQFVASTESVFSDRDVANASISLTNSKLTELPPEGDIRKFQYENGCVAEFRIVKLNVSRSAVHL